MKHAFRKSVASVALLSGMVMAAWSPGSHACSDTPVLASICIMATPATFGSFNRQYVLAAGQQLAINQYTALYSLIGVTYGGDAQTTFKLPDLRGRVIVGADTATYAAGKTGGQASLNLTVAQLPVHNFLITALPVDLTKVTATTTMTGLAATANLSGVAISGTASGLTMKASSTGSGSGSPSNNYLGKAPSAPASLYTSATPDTTLSSDAIGGTLSMTVANAATAPVTVTGNPTTVIGGTATASGTTSTVGTGAAVSIMPPYLTLSYYIAATNGIYPSRD